MNQPTQRPRILLPVRPLTDEIPPPALIELLGQAHVILLGYHQLPEQTAPSQARNQFGDQAVEGLEAMADDLREVGAEVEHRMVFTHEARQTIARVAQEAQAEAVVYPEATTPVEKLLLPMRGPGNLEHLIAFTAGLVRETDIGVTLIHVCTDEDEVSQAELMLHGARDKLIEAGIPETRIQAVVLVSEQPVVALADAGLEHQVIVMGEAEPTLASILLGAFHERVDDRFDGPMIVVRQLDRPTEPTGQTPDEGAL